MQKYESRSYSFKFLGVKFDIDIDDSFSETERREIFAEGANRKEIHYHAKHELFFVPEDTLTVYTNSTAEKFSGALVFIPAFCKHYSSRGDDYRVLFSFEPLGSHKSKFAHFVESYFSCDRPISLIAYSEVSRYLEELCRLLTLEDTATEELIGSVFKLMLYRIYTSVRKPTVTKGARAVESYVIIIERFINSYRSNTSLSAVAAELHLGTKQTSRIIMRIFKKPLSALVTEKRLAVAEELLLTTDMPISKIVEAVNFRSENYFYLCFKKAFGTTPLAYRKRNTK